MIFGIDVSHWQGNFDFMKAKKEGVQYAVLKAGGGDAGLYQDKKFETFYTAAKAAGLGVGAYFFGQAFSEDDAVKEADKFISILAGKQFEYPVYYDVEAKMLRQAKDQLTKIIMAFCDRVEKAGYYVGIYSSESVFNSQVDDKVLARFAHWVAKWSKNEPNMKYSGNPGMWQYGGETNYIRSNRIAGVVCDQDYCYADYPGAIRRAGLNGYTAENVTAADPDNDPTVSVVIGSARIDENGKASGGAAGDQKQGAVPDYSGEVSMQAFYVHSKGWVVIRFNDSEHARKMAEAMKQACNNPNIGYDQGNRLAILKSGTAAAVKTECDCSSLIRQCFIEAAGVDPGNFTTDTEKAALQNTGLVTVNEYTNGMTLYEGDILVTKTKGHTVAVTDGKKRTDAVLKSVDTLAQEVIIGKWGNGDERKKRLTESGYDYAAVQKRVDELFTAQTKKSNKEIAKEVIRGDWGNGDNRKKRLREAGYNPSAIQRIVNGMAQ